MDKYCTQPDFYMLNNRLDYCQNLEELKTFIESTDFSTEEYKYIVDRILVLTQKQLDFVQDNLTENIERLVQETVKRTPLYKAIYE